MKRLILLGALASIYAALVAPAGAYTDSWCPKKSGHEYSGCRGGDARANFNRADKSHSRSGKSAGGPVVGSDGGATPPGKGDPGPSTVDMGDGSGTPPDKGGDDGEVSTPAPPI